MSVPFAHERHIAELAVLRASILTKKVLSTVSKISKSDASPVTVADFAAQALLISALRDAFPGDAFVGEEDSTALRGDEKLREMVWELVSGSGAADEVPELAELARPKSVDDMLDMIDLGGRGQGGPEGRFWVMDPIDGTAAFLKGEQYAVSLALIQDGREVVGVLGCPNLDLQTGRVDESIVDKDGLGIMLSATLNQGATIRTMTPSGLLPASELPRLAPPSSLSDLHFIDCARSKTSRHDLIAQLAANFGAKFPNTDVFSSHMRYAALIVGGGDLQLRIPAGPDCRMYLWDHAGAQLIFREVGGTVTDLDGREMDFGAGRDLNNRNRGLVAVKGEEVHGTVLEALTRIMEEDGKRA